MATGQTGAHGPGVQLHVGAALGPEVGHVQTPPPAMAGMTAVAKMLRVEPVHCQVAQVSYFIHITK